MKQSLIQPLIVYVLWHPAFADGEKLAKQIYSSFSRDIHNPLSRGIGIPVYFRNILDLEKKNSHPFGIDLDKAQRTAVVLMVDDNMVVDKDWREAVKCVNHLMKQQKKSSHILYPVAVTGNAYNIGGDIPQKNYIRLCNVEEEDAKPLFLINTLAQEMCRNLDNIIRETKPGEITVELSPKPIKLFLSHAKKDGTSLARDLKLHIRDKLRVDTFFDSNDIAMGYDFADELVGSIQESVLLVLQNSVLGRVVTGKKGTADGVVQALGRDFGNQWLDEIPTTVEKPEIAAQAIRQAAERGGVVAFNDLLDHYEEGPSSPWYPNKDVSQLIRKIE